MAKPTTAPTAVSVIDFAAYLINPYTVSVWFPVVQICSLDTGSQKDQEGVLNKIPCPTETLILGSLGPRTHRGRDDTMSPFYGCLNS